MFNFLIEKGANATIKNHRNQTVRKILNKVNSKRKAKFQK